jgi:hypothetical protein
MPQEGNDKTRSRNSWIEKIKTSFSKKKIQGDGFGHLISQKVPYNSLCTKPVCLKFKGSVLVCYSKTMDVSKLKFGVHKMVKSLPFC